MEKTFWNALESRHSVYGFGGEKPVPEEEIVKIVEKALTLVPSSFNSQTTRIVVLFGRHHEKLWDIVLDALRKVTDEIGRASCRERV